MAPEGDPRQGYSQVFGTEGCRVWDLSPGASVGGALRSTLAGELRRNCHFLRLGASQKRKVGRDTSVPFFNRFVNWPLKGLRRI